MKIGIIYAGPLVTGSTLRASYIAKYLSKAGHNVNFITPLRQLPLQSDFFFSFFVYTLKVIPERYDVVFVLKPYPNACIPALLKKFQHRDTKILLDVDDLDYAYRKGLVSGIIKFLQKPFPGFFDAVTVHNNNLRAILNKEFGIPEEKIFELRQGVDLDLFNEKNKDKNLRRKLRLENKHVIIYAAHLNIATDLEPILHAFEFVSAEIRDCKLVVVGGGPRQRYYEKKVEGMGLQRNVIFTGYVDKELFPSYIALGDVCVVYYENKLANFYRTSMKLREYLAMKMPVVCNDIGDLRQFHKYTYQTTSDIRDFADKIVDLLINANGAREDGRALKGYEFVKEEYSWEKIIEETLFLFTTLLEKELVLRK